MTHSLYISVYMHAGGDPNVYLVVQNLRTRETNHVSPWPKRGPDKAQSHGSQLQRYHSGYGSALGKNPGSGVLGNNSQRWRSRIRLSF